MQWERGSGAVQGISKPGNKTLVLCIAIYSISHPSKQHEESRRPIWRLLKSSRHIKRSLKHILLAHHLLNPTFQSGGNAIRPHCSKKNKSVEVRYCFLIVSWKLGCLGHFWIEPALPFITVGLHVVPEACNDREKFTGVESDVINIRNSREIRVA